MEKFIEKISKYHILVNLIPGLVFLYSIDLLGIYYLNTENIIQDFFVGYFVGMTLSRIGSLIIEPIFKKIKIVIYAPYSEYLKASSEDTKISELLEDNNMYRTFIATLIMILLLEVGHHIPKISSFLHTSYAGIVSIVILLILYVLAYRKQTSYIRKRVNKVNGKSIE